MFYSVLYVSATEGADAGVVRHINIYADDHSEVLDKLLAEHNIYTNSVISINPRNFY